MPKCLSFLFIVFLCCQAHAQEFMGFVRKMDSTHSAIYQAKVEVREEGQPFKSLKTYFDGSFKFTPNKGQKYSVHISYPGYTDTTYSFTSDKNGIPDTNKITVTLRKDGMRLLGMVKNKEDDFPISGVCVVLKNVVTREETRITTGIEGTYNFKLMYETNYRVYVDKRSPGIDGRFKDTTFYVSTIGFNLPLDYKLNIALDPLPGSDVAPKPYNATNTVTAANTPKKKDKQDDKLKSVEEKINQLQAELEKAKNELKGIKTKDEPVKTENPATATGKTGKKESTPAAIIKDKKDESVDKNNNVEVVSRLEEKAKKRTEEREAELAAQRALEEKKNAELAHANELEKQKSINDSIARAQVEQQRIAKEAEERKIIEDSIAKAQVAQQAIADSIARANAEQERIAKEAEAQRMHNDSLAKAAAAKKVYEDSLAQVKAEKERIAKETAAQKIYQDSLNKATAVAAKKATADSITHVKAEQEKIAKELKAQKLVDDSLAKDKAKQEAVAKEAAKKAIQDSINKVKLEARQKFVDDSVARVQVQNEKKAAEAAIRKAKQDSINNVMLQLRQKIASDSIARVEVEREKKAQEAAVRKLVQDSIAKVKFEVRQKFVADSTARAKVAEDKKKAEAAIKKAQADSIFRVRVQARIKAEEDSLARVKAIREKKEAEAAAKKAYQDSVTKVKVEAHQKHVVDSIMRVKEKEAKQLQEEAAQKPIHDSIAKALLAAWQKSIDDSAANVVAEKGRQQQAAKDSAPPKNMGANIAAAPAQPKPATPAPIMVNANATAPQKSVFQAGGIFNNIPNISGKTFRYTLTVKDIGTDAPLAGVHIYVGTGNGENVAHLKTDDRGVCTMGLLSDSNYYFVLRNDSYRPVHDTLKKIAGKSVTLTSRKIEMQKDLSGPEWPAVLFETNSASIDAKAKQQLKETAKKLSVYNSRIKVYAFTAFDEDTAINLAAQRTNTVVQYLIQKGVVPDKIQTVKYNTPVSRNGCASADCGPELLQQNRSVVFEIIE